MLIRFLVIKKGRVEGREGYKWKKANYRFIAYEMSFARQLYDTSDLTYDDWVILSTEGCSVGSFMLKNIMKIIMNMIWWISCCRKLCQWPFVILKCVWSVAGNDQVSCEKENINYHESLADDNVGEEWKMEIIKHFSLSGNLSTFVLILPQYKRKNCEERNSLLHFMIELCLSFSQKSFTSF